MCINLYMGAKSAHISEDIHICGCRHLCYRRVSHVHVCASALHMCATCMIMKQI